MDEIALARAVGEGEEVMFDPGVHPGIVFRAFLLGLRPDQVAPILGISEVELEQWLKTYPEMRMARYKALLADAEVVEALFDSAVGYKDKKTGRRKGASVRAQKLWIEARLGWKKNVRLRSGSGPGPPPPSGSPRSAPGHRSEPPSPRAGLRTKGAGPRGRRPRWVEARPP